MAGFNADSTHPANPPGETRLQELQQRIAEFQALDRVTVLVTQSLDLDEVMEAALDVALDLLRVEAGAISLVDEQKDALVFRAQKGWRHQDFVRQGVSVPLHQGLSGLAVRTGQIVVTGDVSNDPRVAIPAFREEGIQAMALAPMRARGRAVGVLGVMSYEPRTFTEHETAILSSIADRIGLAIDNARLYDEALDREQFATALGRVALALNSTLELPRVLDLICRESISLFDLDGAFVWLVEGDRLVGIAGEGPGRDAFLGMSLPLSEQKALGVRVIQEARPIYLNAVQQMPEAEKPANRYLFELFNVQSILGVPLLKGKRPVGALMLVDARHPDRFGARDVERAALLGTQAALAIENARLYAQTQRRLQEQSALHEVAVATRGLLNPQAVIERGLAALIALFELDMAALFFMDRQGRLIPHTMRGASHREWEALRRKPIPLQALLLSPPSDPVEAHHTAEIAEDVEALPPGASPLARQMGMRTMAILPLVASGRLLGFVSLGARRPAALNRKDIPLLESLSTQLAVAIENARLYEQMERRLEELSSLSRVSAALNRALSLEEILTIVLDEAQSLIHYQTAAILLRREEDETLYVAAARGMSQEEIRRFNRQQITCRQGCLAQVWDQGNCLEIDEAHHVPDVIPLTQTIPPRLTYVPLRTEVGVIGLIVLDDVPTNEATRHLLLSLADIAAAAIRKARLYGETERRVAELTALQEVSLQVTSSLDLWTVLETITQSALKLTQAQTVQIYLYDSQRERLIFGTAMWADGNRRPLVGHPSRDGFIAQVAHTGHPDFVEEVARHPHPDRLEIGRHPLQALAGFPLKRADQVLGVLTIAYGETHRFSDDEVRMLNLLADQAAIAVDHARLFALESRRSAHMALINQVARQATATLDLGRLLQRAAHAIRANFGRFHVALFLMDEERDHVVLRAVAGGHADLIQPGYELPVGEGIVGWVAQRGETLVINDVEQDPRYRPFSPEQKVIRSEMAVPLKLAGQVIGVLDVQDLEPGAFDEDHVRALETLADQLAVAIDNARLYEEVRRRLTELSALQEVTLQITASLDVHTVLDTIVRHGLSITKADNVHIYLYDEAQGRFTIGTALWQDGRRTPAVKEPRPHGLTSTVQRTGRPLIINDAPSHPLFQDGKALQWKLHAIAGFPLRHGHQVLGVFTAAYRRPHRFSEHEIRLFTLLADQAAIAIANARLFQETQRRLEEVTLLHRVALAATSAPDFNTLVSQVVEALRRTLDADYVDLLLLDPKQKTLVFHPSLKEEAAPEETYQTARIPLGQGITGTVAQTGEPLRVNDVRHDPRYLELYGDVRSELCVPRQVGDQVIGVIDLESTRPNAFSLDDERLMVTVARQLAVIMENTRLHQETQRRLAEVTALYKFAQQLSRSLEMDKVLETIVSSLKEVLGCRGVSIALLDPETEVLEIRAAAGLQERWKREARLKVGEGVMGQVASTATPMYVADTYACEGFIFFDKAVRSLMVVPLLVKDRVIGTLSVDHAIPNAFTEDDERLLTIAAAQAAIAIENARLVQGLRERAEALAKAYEELKELDRMKDELIQNVSHELRTPLTFVKGYVELLLAGDMGPLNEEQMKSLRIVANKTNTVTRLVGDIVLLQQIEQEQLDLVPVSLVSIARRAIAGSQATAVRQGVQIELEAPPDLPPALGDEGRLEQVFDNLLGNAIKFSPGGGEVRVMLEETEDAILVQVSDQGIGIPADKLDRIFDRFYQVDGSSTRRFGGTGLGLAIVKRIVEAHGGRVWVTSQEGKGSTFYFTIPKAGTRA